MVLLPSRGLPLPARISTDRPRVRGVDLRSQRRRVALGGEAVERHVHHRGVTEEGSSVGVRQSHRLDHEMEAAGVVAGEVRIAFEDVEHLDQHNAARRRRRHRHDVMAAIAAAQRRALDRAVILQILRRHDAAVGLNGGRDAAGGLALVERAGAVACDRRQRVGEIALEQRVAGRERAAIRLEEDFGRGRPARHPPLHARQRIGDIVLDRDAVARKLDRGRYQFGEREFARAVFLMREREPGHRAGYSDRERGLARLARVGVAFLVEKDVARGGGRRGLAIVDRDVDCHRRGGSPCSRRRRYCRRADRSRRARSRSRPRHRPHCRPAAARRRRCGRRASPAPPPCRRARQPVGQGQAAVAPKHPAPTRSRCRRRVRAEWAASGG